jgi:hypothetical protein
VGAGWAEPILKTVRRTGKDVTGRPLTCDLCDRRLKVHGGYRINGGYFPCGAQARDDGLYTWVGRDGKRVGSDVICLVFYCWRCNRKPKTGGLSRVDKTIRSVKQTWRFENYIEGEGDLARALRKAMEHGRFVEYGAPTPQQAAMRPAKGVGA